MGQALRILSGILLVIGGLCMFMLISVGSHGHFPLVPRRWDDVLTWNTVLVPILGGALLFGWKKR